MADPVLVLKRFREEGCSVRLLHPQRCVQHVQFLVSKWCCEGVLDAPAAPSGASSTHKPLNDHADVLGWGLASCTGCFDIPTILNRCQPI